MCNNKCNDIISVFVSVLVGIGFVALSFLGIFTEIVIGQWIAVGITVLAVIVLVLVAASLVRQDTTINKCICRVGRQLLFAVFVLFAITVISILFAIINAYVFYILVFLVSGFSAYALLRMYCLIKCYICPCEHKICDK